MRTIKTYAECLADEFMLAGKADSASGAIKKKEEIEKNAQANR
jgi:ribosomal protein S7